MFYYEKRIICINRDLGWSEKEASMLDLSADNRDGFEDTDGQLYTSNSFYFFDSRDTQVLL